eukprot:1037775-Pleurochrysis_carterae.AAC.4
MKLTRDIVEKDVAKVPGCAVCVSVAVFVERDSTSQASVFDPVLRVVEVSTEARWKWALRREQRKQSGKLVGTQILRGRERHAEQAGHSPS